MCNLLAPFAEHMNTLQVDTLGLSSVVVPVLLDLTCRIQACRNVNGLVEMSDVLLQQLSTRYDKFTNNTAVGFDPLPAAACYVDPSTAPILRGNGVLLAARAYIFQQVNNVLMLSHDSFFKCFIVIH